MLAHDRAWLDVARPGPLGLRAGFLIVASLVALAGAAPSARRSPTFASWTTSAPRSRRCARSPASDRRDPGGRHARQGARAAQHDRPVRRRQRLVGAARDRRARQHRGEGQVPLGARCRRRRGRRTTSRSACCSCTATCSGAASSSLIGGRIATVDSGAALAYRDPAFFGSWIYWQVQGIVQRQNIPEYYHGRPRARTPAPTARRCSPRTASSRAIGIAWFRRVKTQVAWRLEQFNFNGSYVPTRRP